MIRKQTPGQAHPDIYPEQYQHPLCGKLVRVTTHTGYITQMMVERVVSTRFGLLACPPGDPNQTAYLITDCTVIEKP